MLALLAFKKSMFEALQKIPVFNTKLTGVGGFACTFSNGLSLTKSLTCSK
jgi:hypothetical protein